MSTIFGKFGSSGTMLPPPQGSSAGRASGTRWRCLVTFSSLMGVLPTGCGNGTEESGNVEGAPSASESDTTTAPSATGEPTPTGPSTPTEPTTPAQPSTAAETSAAPSTDPTPSSVAPTTTTSTTDTSATSDLTSTGDSSGSSDSSTTTADPTSTADSDDTDAGSDTPADTSDTPADTMDEPEPLGVCPPEPGTAPTGTMDATEIAVTRSDPNAFVLFEGPAWTEGALYFSEINPNPWDSNIRKYVPGIPDAEVFLENAGTNGLAVDAMGVLFSATTRTREISKYDLASKMVTSIVSGSFNTPNDLAIASDGTIYFSAPIQPEVPQDLPPGTQAPSTVVHIVKDGQDAVFSEEITPPNGVTLSPADDVLYVAVLPQGVVKKVTLKADGTADTITDFATGLSAPDGMSKDCLGNIYIAEHDGARVSVYSPNGQQLAAINVGMANFQQAKPTNVAFGGADRKTLFITASYSLWQVELAVAGYPD